MTTLPCFLKICKALSTGKSNSHYGLSEKSGSPYFFGGHYGSKYFGNRVHSHETTKEIVVENYKRGQQGEKGRLEIQEKKNIRHEIVHAFLFESGLAENSEWAQNEEMVDWFACQAPKIYAAFRAAGAI